MADPDIASLWETKKNADIWLMMGEEKWELHDKVIRGKSEMVDFLVDQKAAMDERVKKFALKDHLFKVSALETVLKWLYVGDDALPHKPEIFDLLMIHDVAASLGVSDLTAELASRVGCDLSDILAKRVDMLEDFMAVADIIVDETSDAHDDLKQEFQKAIGPHLCMLLQQQDFCNLLQDDPKFCFDTLSTAVSEITRVTEESEQKLADAEKQHRVNDSAIDFPTFDTPASKKPAQESAIEGPKTPDTSKKIILESPPSVAEAIGPDLMRIADAGSTPFAGPRFSRGMDAGAFNFAYKDEREFPFPPKFSTLSIKRGPPTKPSPAVKSSWAPTPFPTPCGKASPSDDGSEAFESCEEGSEEGEIREKRRVIPSRPSIQSKMTPPDQIAHKAKTRFHVPGSFEASLAVHTRGVGTSDVHSKPATSLPTDRRSGGYHLSSSSIQQDDTLELPARRSGSYALGSTSIQQDSLVPDEAHSEQPELKRTADTNPATGSRTMPSSHKEHLQRPAPREEPVRAPSPAPSPAFAPAQVFAPAPVFAPTSAPASAETGPKLDHKTAREVERGRLNVKTTKRAKTSKKMYDADAPNIDCVQS
ncbi:hypothetical protein N0V92_011098 [Colletotrichum tropicale]|nr:hypothetical protein N0V92_011098 [Colletotrichum tropicale]